MADVFIGRLGLAISLGMCHDREAGLASQVLDVVRELASVKLPTIVKNYGTRDVKLGDDFAPYELRHLSGGYGCNGLGFDPFSEVFPPPQKDTCVGLWPWEKGRGCPFPM